MRFLLGFSTLTFLFSLCAFISDQNVAALSIWLKPLKFSLSLSMYAGSLLYCSSFIEKRNTLYKCSIVGAALGAVIELTALLVQSAGLSLNIAFLQQSSIEETISIVTRTAITPVALADLVLLILLLRQKNLPSTMGNAIRWGMLLAAVGFIPGFLMLTPEAVQHSLYSGSGTSLGDLRTAHFVGLHALQIIPLIAFGIEKLSKWFTVVNKQMQSNLVATSGYSYFVLILLLIWQALRGEPVLSMGSETQTALIAYFIGMLAGILFAITSSMKQALPFFQGSKLQSDLSTRVIAETKNAAERPSKHNTQCGTSTEFSSQVSTQFVA